MRVSRQGVVDAPEAGTGVAGRYIVAGSWHPRGDGTLWARAHDRVLRRPVLLKVAARDAGEGEAADDGRGMAGLLHETQLLSRYAHPGIARVYDLGSASGLTYAVQQWVDGPTLASLCTAGSLLPPATAAAVVRALCTLPESLAAYVTADDVVLAANGSPVLVSISPPRGHVLDACPRDDAAVPALAGLLYELVVGEKIERGSGAGTPVPAHRRRAAVPPGLSLAIMEGLAPSRPHGDLAAFSRALTPYAGGTPTRRAPNGAGRVRPAGKGDQKEAPSRPRRAWPAFAGPLVVGVLAAVPLAGGVARLHATASTASTHAVVGGHGVVEGRALSHGRRSTVLADRVALAAAR